MPDEVGLSNLEQNTADDDEKAEIYQSCASRLHERVLMTELPLHARVDDLLRLSDEVNRIAGALAHLSIGLASPTTSVERAEIPVSDEATARAVNWIIRARRDRARYVSTELFSDPAWDILLDLLRAELAQQRVAVSSLCIASGVPQTTALRYLQTMVQRGMIIRRADPRDGRRVFVELSSELRKSLRRYIAELIHLGDIKEAPKRSAG